MLASPPGTFVRQRRKEAKLCVTVLAWRQAGVAVVDQYSTVLCARSLLAHTDVAVMADREALHDIYRSNGDPERVLITFVPIHLFQVRFADTENSYLSPPSVVRQLVAKLVDVLLDW